MAHKYLGLVRFRSAQNAFGSIHSTRFVGRGLKHAKCKGKPLSSAINKIDKKMGRLKGGLPILSLILYDNIGFHNWPAFQFPRDLGVGHWGGTMSAQFSAILHPR